ncbi:putative membrane protein [Rickettsia amblyommatis str. Darkwater]|nr:putative membrane protein [Rickettsia amblyommatis str. Darkwater]
MQYLTILLILADATCCIFLATLNMCFAALAYSKHAFSPFCCLSTK